MDDFTENSIDLEDTREDYKNELIMLHASLKALNSALDFSAILNPLLAETGPAMTHKPLAVQAAQQHQQNRRPIF
jgi:hypothetical protein